MAQSIGRTAFFDKTYDEALALTEQAHAYLAEIYHKGTSINDATDVKLGRSRGSRGSRSGVGVGVFGVLRLPGGSVPLSMRAPGRLLP